MPGTTKAAFAKSKDNESIDEIKKNESSLGGIFLVAVVFFGFTFFMFCIVEKINSPPYLVDNLISSTDKLNKKLKGRILIIKKDGFSDSASYKDANEIQAELEFVRDKLIELKIKLKNKPWAN